MRSQAWLNQDHQFAPGKELFRSDRKFSLWAYTVSHSQLLLRSRTVAPGGGSRSRIDVLFKPAEGVKTRIDYHGLVIRCATDDERQHILAETGNEDRSLRVFVLESTGGLDYVVAGAVGWREDGEEDRDPSRLAFFAPASDPKRILPSE